MSTKITCPVCDRSAIEINICPNCQTDLSLIRMLSELPQAGSVSDDSRWLGWPIGILLTNIILIWGLWFIF
jgi:C4-type Zn-finger protein